MKPLNDQDSLSLFLYFCKRTITPEELNQTTETLPLTARIVQEVSFKACNGLPGKLIQLAERLSAHEPLTAPVTFADLREGRTTQYMKRATLRKKHVFQAIETYDQSTREIL